MPHRKTIAVVASTLAGVFARLSSLASQAVIGIYLTEEQVGTYALALGIMGITGIWRSGGAATYLPSVKPADFDRLANPMFLWAACAGLATTLLTVAIALLDDRLPESMAAYRLPGLPAVLLVLAARSLTVPFALIGRMRLSVEHRFLPLAKVDVLNALARFAMTWGIAAEGGGALALAIPYTAQNAIEIVAVVVLGGIRRADIVPRLRAMWTAAPLLAWPLLLAIIMSLRADVSFLLVGVILPAAALGVFYFAFQLANQPTMFLAGSLQNVLAPMIARFRGLPDLERIGMERVFAASMLFVPITTMAAASFFPTAERLIWGGKWSAASASVVLLCIGATYATVVGLVFGPLIGLQRFKASAGFELLKMFGIVGGALCGVVVMRVIPASIAETASDITIVSGSVAFGMATTSLAQLLWIARHYRFEPADTARNLVFGPLLAGLTAIAAQSIGHSIIESMQIQGGRLGALIELTAIAATYTLLITLALRFTAESTLRDTILMLPPKARGIASRAFFLN